MAKPLQRLTYNDVTDQILGDNKCMNAFLELRDKLCSTPALRIPDYDKEFILY